MDDNGIKLIKLERHQTKDIHDQHVNGSLTVIWRDWDNILSSEPRMIYLTSVNPGEIKGPHLHTKRDSYFTCIRGKVLFIVKDLENKYHEIECSEDDPLLIKIPKNYPSAHINLSNQVSTILTLASISWRPNDEEMKNVSFDNYDWKKWKNFLHGKST